MNKKELTRKIFFVVSDFKSCNVLSQRVYKCASVGKFMFCLFCQSGACLNEITFADETFTKLEF